MTRSAAVTGMGCVSAAGIGYRAAWDVIRRAQTPRTPFSDARCLPVARAPKTEELAEAIPGVALPRPPRTTLLAMAAAEEAWAMAKVPSDAVPERLGLFLNRSLGQHEVVGRYYNRLWDTDPGGVSGLQFIQTIANAVLGSLALRYTLRGPSSLFFGFPAMGPSLDSIRAGNADIVLTGGLDELSEYYLDLSLARGVVSSEPGTARPYDTEGSGLVPGDAGACLVLEAPDHALSRGAAVLGYLKGYGAVQDRGISSGAGARHAGDIAESMRRALADARVAANDIDLAIGSGAGLRAWDEPEATAFRDVFASMPYVTSAKGSLGETWGASGFVGAIAALCSIADGCVPPTAGARAADPVLGDRVPLNAAVRRPVHNVLVCAHDICGQNSAFVVSEEP